MFQKYIDFKALIVRLRQGIPTGDGTLITLATLIAIYSLSVVTSLPGLAISPILGDLQRVFHGSSELKIQMLESLPSLIIIPFILLSGSLSVRMNKHKLLMSGLGIFFTSSVLYMVTKNLDFMLFNSILLGIGAGIVIPLSTGLIAEYFKGKERTRQLGIVSAISNISLVGATMLAGFLAGLGWHYAFLVYGISVISIIFASKLKPRKASDQAAADKAAQQRPAIETALYKPLVRFGIKTTIPVGVMLFYFLITIIVLVIPFNLAIYTEYFHSASVAVGGTMISVFFLAITTPGLFITRIAEKFGKRTIFWSMCLMLLGLLLLLLPHHQLAIWIGIILVGLSYGVMQPLIYDRTASSVIPSKVTFALSMVMSMNYIAIIIYPFFQNFQSAIFRTQSTYLPFIVSAAIALIYVAVKLKNKS